MVEGRIEDKGDLAFCLLMDGHPDITRYLNVLRFNILIDLWFFFLFFFAFLFPVFASDTKHGEFTEQHGVNVALSLSRGPKLDCISVFWSRT